MSLETEGLLSLQELKEKIEFKPNEYIAKIKVSEDQVISNILKNCNNSFVENIADALNAGAKTAKFHIHSFELSKREIMNLFLEYLKNKGYNITNVDHRDGSFMFVFTVTLYPFESDV